MTWTDFYLICFLVGLLLSVFSIVAGSLHLPHAHFDFGHHFHFDLHADAGGHGSDMPFINFGTIMAFLTWFGGVGYLLTRHVGGLGGWIVLLASIGGLAGAAIVSVFLTKVLLRDDRDLDPADYDPVGVIGRVSNSIREGGTGEIIFVQEGTRRVFGARSDTGIALPKGTEVIVTRYERGIAYVRKWDELEASIGVAGQLKAEE